MTEIRRSKHDEEVRNKCIAITISIMSTGLIFAIGYKKGYKAASDSVVNNFFFPEDFASDFLEKVKENK